ncbi:MAG: 2-C-methyl-D-erythritol 4-phosphate cytidylyltransferase [Oscillospiraceae bacterium]|nr:2-C-methyl-D-erythritol 4-phosphate cytidylyltransferase [Oscillospiraceae bacterium]
MVYGVILAGGVGSRMGNAEKPKQFLLLGDKPLIIHTIEKFSVHPEIDRVVVLSPAQWVTYTQGLIEKHLPGEEIPVLAGGDTRNETLMNAIRYIETQPGSDENTIIVTHDAVRPFVTSRIISENIEAAKKYGATDTVICATDTIVVSKNHKTIDEIPERPTMYQGQTPQSFRMQRVKELYEGLTDEEKEILTDACKIMVMKGDPVYLVQGEVFNIKITYPYDLKVAEALLTEER